MIWQGKTFAVLAALRIFNSVYGGEGHSVSYRSPWSLTAGDAKQFDKRLENFAL